MLNGFNVFYDMWLFVFEIAFDNSYLNLLFIVAYCVYEEFVWVCEFGVKPSKTIQNKTKSSKAIQSHKKQCQIIQNPRKPSKTIQSCPEAGAEARPGAVAGAAAGAALAAGAVDSCLTDFSFLLKLC